MTLLPSSVYARGAALLRAVLPCLALALFTGCQKPEIQVYRVPKESELAAAQAQPEAAPSTTSPTGRPQIGWKTPTGWIEKAGDKMRVVSFLIKGAGTNSAEVAVMPFGSMGGSDLQFVNLWRDQLKLAPVTDAELGQFTEDVTIGGAAGKLFDVYGKDTPSENRPTERIIVSMLKRDGVMWFFKLAGDGEVVVKEKPAYLEFLKSIVFREPDASMASAVQAPPPSSTGGGEKPAWEVPAGWKEVAPGQMILARFQVPAETKTEVTVSVFPGDVGGLLANVNRWRGQLQLPPVDQAGLAQVVTSLDVPGGQAMLVDMTSPEGKGPKTRLIGVIWPRGGQTWFYKLMGDVTVAEREKPALLQFVRSAK